MDKNKVLIVEDSLVISKLLDKSFSLYLPFEVQYVKTFSEAQDILKTDHEFFISIVSYNLPGAPNGEIIDLMFQNNLPVVVLTSTYTNEFRAEMILKNVLDYVLKDSRHNIERLCYLIKRLFMNHLITILVVDDSETALKTISMLLKQQKYKVLEAENGNIALNILKENPNISMVITDYNMPGINGFELVELIRQDHHKNKLAIIGISSSEDKTLSAQFLKKGANDFLIKPFIKEEFYCRVTQNIEMMEYISQIQDTAERDFLTKLNNRKYLFEKGEILYETMKTKNKKMAIGMIDIDYFKKINDTFGHDIGDKALKHVSEVLLQNLRQADIISRYGGEEFCVVLTNIQDDDVLRIFNRVRSIIEAEIIQMQGRNEQITVSIGVTSDRATSFETMINNADDNLYKAKESGRNRVVGIK